MAEIGFPRQKRVTRGRDARDPQIAATGQAEISSHRVAPREAFDVARYVTDIAAQLEAMAVAAQLDSLAYFLGMAKAEGDLFVRDNARADGAAKELGDAGSVDPENHHEMSFD
jgi:hypothetical protein